MTAFAYHLHLSVEDPRQPEKRRNVILIGDVDADPGADVAYGMAAVVEALREANERVGEAVGKAA